MTLGELKRIIDSLHDTHGGEIKTTFEHKWASGRSSRSDITSYGVSISPRMSQAIFKLNHPRGELVDE